MTNDTPEIAALREKFEEWASTHFTESRLLRDESGKYNPTIDFIWEAFQAGAQSTPREVPEAVREAAKRYNPLCAGYTIDQMAVDQPYKDMRTLANYAIEHMQQLKGLNDA